VHEHRWLSRALTHPHQSPYPAGQPGKSSLDHCFSSSLQHRLDLPSTSLQHTIILYHSKVFLLPTFLLFLFNNLLLTAIKKKQVSKCHYPGCHCHADLTAWQACLPARSLSPQLGTPHFPARTAQRLDQINSYLEPWQDQGNPGLAISL